MGIGRTILAATRAFSVAMLPRAIAILLVGILICSPFVVFAAGVDAIADAQMMSSDMAMESMAATADEMPCHHKDNSDSGKNCPSMAICMALCCQAIAASPEALATPAPSASRMLPPALVQLDGINFPPPSRPPKA
jgi:hypothetical protein